MTQIADDMRSIARLFGDAVDNLSKLIQTEIQLARTEITQKATQAGIGAGMLVGALFFLTPALVLLLIAFAIWLTQLGFSPVTAHLLAGCIALVISAILAGIGISRLKPEALTPKNTISEVRRDITAAKEMTS